MQLGEKLKKLRLEKKLTLDALSVLSGVSKSLLSQMERDISTPTIKTLEKVTSAFGTSAADLLSQSNKMESERITVVHKDRRKKLFMPGIDIQYELLSPDLQHRVELLYIRHPVGVSTQELFVHSGEECGIVLKGTLTGIIGHQKVTLTEGDSITFDSSIPHRWENLGNEEVVTVWVIAPPSF